MSGKIRIIDLFAGPGGLGEGFAGCTEDSPFEIAMSVEAEPYAHTTLTHRAFYRLLPPAGRARFVQYIQSKSSEKPDTNLLQLKSDYPDEWLQAQTETMGAPTRLGNSRIWQKLKDGENITEEDKLDTDDQKRISKRVSEIKKKCREDESPLVVIGGPPCQSYSGVGRIRVNSIEGYKPDEDQRFFLYLEYTRVLSEAQPEIFVMENVPGILSARLANGKLIFPQILEALEEPYRTVGKQRGSRYFLYSFSTEPESVSSSGNPEYGEMKDYVVNAEDHGVPQSRKRVIILGIRQDLGPISRIVEKNKSPAPTIGDVIGTLPEIRSTCSKRNNHSDSADRWNHEWIQASQVLIKKLADTKVKSVIREAVKHQRSQDLSPGDPYFVPSNQSGFSVEFDRRVRSNEELKELKDWIGSAMGGFANHTAKGHMAHDRMIYMYVAAFARAFSDRASPSPKSGDFPDFLAPDHKNWKSGYHVNRFRCFEESHVGKTITSHLKKDGHAYIHYDVTQNRSLSPREAARVQTFPDDYFFEGPVGAQYQQVGNAVPPFLASKLAKFVYKILEDKKK